jgi:prepilin-type N-terminal cleavage/methylation domain-containing protein
MREDSKAKMCFSGKRTCRAMGRTAREQGGAALDNRGFTMIELLIVLVIVSCLCAIAIPAFSKARDSARAARCKADISTLQNQIALFQTERGTLPPGLSDLPSASTKDPWGRDYEYTPGGKTYLDINNSTFLNDDYDLFSWGPDGKTAHKLEDVPANKDSMDDIVRINDGGDIILGSKR